MGYIAHGNLSVDAALLNFINDTLLPAAVETKRRSGLDLMKLFISWRHEMPNCLIAVKPCRVNLTRG